MNQELFEELKKIDGWKYEICVGSGGYTAKLERIGSNLKLIKTGKSMDDLAEWIIEETKTDREA